jgi:hypothetical protein
MNQLLDRLLARWTQAFDELDTIDRYKALVKTYRYAGAPRFDLSDFENQQFSDKEDWTAEEEMPDWRETCTYGLNQQGLPCYTTARHNYNKVDWAGFYTYSDHLVEHLEFNLATKIPSCLQRIEYQDGKKIVYFSLRVNGGGSYSIDLGPSKEEISRRLINDPYALILSVDHYHFDERGKVVRADGISKIPGIGQFSTRDEYTYDADDILLTIRRFFRSGLGTDRLIYSRIPDGVTPEMIIEKLATALSLAVVDAIVDDRQKEAARSGIPHSTEEPIGLVNLTYSYNDSYYPSAGYQLVRTINQDLKESIFNFYSFVREASDIKTDQLQDLYAQLDQLIHEQNDAGLGRNMLRKTAAILVHTRLHGRLPVPDDFGALAMDGHIEGHSDEDMEEILLACGNDPATLSLWKEKGMF